VKRSRAEKQKEEEMMERDKKSRKKERACRKVRK